MEISKGSDLTQAEINVLEQKFGEIHFKSRLLFLSEHNGLRRGNIHLLLSTTGAGKSTLLRTMFLDALASVGKNQKVLMYLSEESLEKFNYDIAQTGMLKHGAALKNKFDAISEVNCNQQQLKNSFNFLIEQIRSKKYGIIFLDNITTATFYITAPLSRQFEMCNELKAAAYESNTALVVIAHTDKNTTQYSKKIIDPQDIRGQKHLSNISEYIYALHNFYNDDRRATVFMIIKYRDGNVKNKYWKVSYNPEMKIYSECRAIPFQVIQEKFKEMDKL